MKTDHLYRHLASAGLCSVVAVCTLVLGPDARINCATAASKKPPVFSDVPGLTSNAPPPTTGGGLPVITQPPVQVQVPVQAPPPVVQPAPAPSIVVAPPAAPSEEQGAGKTLYSFQAADLDLKIALTTFARANNLNIVPDHDITGTVTLDVRDLPLAQMMRALLEANDCTWQEENGLIRVRSTETRTFTVDYLRLSRKGTGYSSATLGSGTSSGGGGLGGGTGGGGGGFGGGTGGGGTGGSGGGGNGNGGAYGAGGSSVNLSADNTVDFWKELKAELEFILTDAGRKSMAVNMTAGILQVTDRPSALKRVETYLTGVDRSIHRQVEIDAKIYNVTLNDQFQFGIDWVHLAEAYGGTMGFGGATLPVANGGAQLLNSSLGGLNTFPGSSLTTLIFTNFNTGAAVNAMAQQGNVEVISKPRLRTLNNQTAMIKVGEEVPFFNGASTVLQSAGGSTGLGSITVNSVTIGTILSLTPQISDTDWVSLEISPVLTSLNATETFTSGEGTTAASATAPDLNTKQAASLVRVKDGSTVVLGGLIQTQEARNDTKVPILGDIPLLGKLFTGTFRFKQRQELVIFVTPHIVRDGMERPIPVVPDVVEMPHKP